MAMTLKEAREWLVTIIAALGLIAATIGAFGVYVVHKIDELNAKQASFELRVIERQTRTEGQIALLHRMFDEIAILGDKIKTLENRMNEPQLRR
jgi:hypothetical protein